MERKMEQNKNGAFIDELGFIDLLDAITHVEIENTIEYICIFTVLPHYEPLH
jgi:hypothetical protein